MKNDIKNPSGKNTSNEYSKCVYVKENIISSIFTINIAKSEATTNPIITYKDNLLYLLKKYLIGLDIVRRESIIPKPIGSTTLAILNTYLKLYNSKLVIPDIVFNIG